jgi:hypothetical protein
VFYPWDYLDPTIQDFSLYGDQIDNRNRSKYKENWPEFPAHEK